MSCASKRSYVVPGLRIHVMVPRRRDRTTRANAAKGSPIELEGVFDKEKDLVNDDLLDDEK